MQMLQTLANMQTTSSPFHFAFYPSQLCHSLHTTPDARHDTFLCLAVVQMNTSFWFYTCGHHGYFRAYVQTGMMYSIFSYLYIYMNISSANAHAHVPANCENRRQWICICVCMQPVLNNNRGRSGYVQFIAHTWFCRKFNQYNKCDTVSKPVSIQ